MFDARRCLWVVALTAACAPILRTEQALDKPLSDSVRREPIEGTLTFEAAAKVNGDLLVVMLEQSETCNVITTPRQAREMHVTRRVETKWIGGAWGVAALGVVVGALTYIDAEGIAANEMAKDPSSTATADDYRAVGAILGAAGVVAAVVAVGNQLRAGESVEDGGVVNGHAQTERSACRRRPVSNEAVALYFDRDTSVTSSTGQDGRVEFALTNLPLAALPRPGRDLTLEIAGRERISIPLTTDDTAEIERALLANPDSQLARDRAEARRRECRAALAKATEVSALDVDARPDEVLDLWSSAKRTCADQWSADDEVAASVVRKRAMAAACNLALYAVTTAVTNAVGRDDVASGEASLARAENVCTDDGRLATARTRYAAAVEKVQAQEAAAAERAALLEGLAEVERAMEGGDAEAAFRLVMAQPEIRTVITDDTRTIAWDLLGTSIENVLHAAPSKAAAEESMCFARSVFKALAGKAALASGVQRFVNRFGTSDPALAARVVRALKAGRCK